MKHKLMIYIPLVLFVSATIVLGLAVIKQRADNSIAIPPEVLAQPTPTLELAPTAEPTQIVTPTPVDSSIQIKSDLNAIMQDIGKIRVEDTRFKPPVFEFEMGI